MLARAELALSEGLNRNATNIAKRAIVSEAGQESPAATDLRLVLGLALTAAGQKRDGLRLCEEALTAALEQNDFEAILRSRMAVLYADISLRNSDHAHKVFADLEPTLASHPESRWRALAMITVCDRQYLELARLAGDDLARLWGEPAYHRYRTRPDIQKLSRPLAEPLLASKQ
jgi:hypothetical protein